MPDNILTREEYAERINDAYFDQGMGMATHDVLLHHDAALRAEVGRLKDALDRQAAHYGGALSIEKARADAAERDASMLRRALNDAESALGAELKKTDRLERALREISRNIAENLPMTGLDAHINAIAAAALAEIEGVRK